MIRIYVFLQKKNSWRDEIHNYFKFDPKFCRLLRNKRRHVPFETIRRSSSSIPKISPSNYRGLIVANIRGQGFRVFFEIAACLGG